MSTPTVDPADTGDTPEPVLRKDAARNREKILEAAGELFALEGLGVTLNEVAHYAGVGVGTVYRHFPDREQLIDTLFEARVEEMVANVEAGLADPDPWHGLVSTIERSLELQAANRGLHQLMVDSPATLEKLVNLRGRLLPLGLQLVTRAQEAGALRSDIEPSDLPMIQLMLGSVIDAARDVDPEVWRRYFALTLRGLAASPETLAPLPGGSLDPDDLDRVMTASKSTRRG